MNNDIANKIERIRKLTRIKVDTFKVNNTGGESLIIDINNKWIFRFPRTNLMLKKSIESFKFQESFAKVSPVKVPIIKYLAEDFIGYKKLAGRHISPSTIERLSVKDKIKIAKELGSFLKALHSFKSNKITKDTGYLVMRKKDYQTCPKEIVKHLNSKETNHLKLQFKAIANNKMNFTANKKIIHGDFHFNNILWNFEKKKLTGVIDWSEAGYGVPAMDFIMLADFSKPKNDIFLKNMLLAYGEKDGNLFNQIKENYIIDVMNWYWTYLQEDKPKSQARTIKKLKRILGS